jgi:CRP/FNR family transcriptional regulator
MNRAPSFRENDRLQGMRHGDVDQLAMHAKLVAVPRRTVLWRPGSPADLVFWVRSGIIKVSRTMDQSRDLTLRFLTKGDLFGVSAALSTGSRRTVAEAYQDAEVFAVSASAFRRQLKRSADFSFRVASLVEERRRVVEERIGVLLFKTAHARLASVLLDLARDFGVRDSRGVIVNLKLTHKEMASLIGATRETVSFAIVDLRKAGLIMTEGKRVILLDQHALKQLAAS